MPVKLRKSLKALKNKVSITKKQCHTETIQKSNAKNEEKNKKNSNSN